MHDIINAQLGASARKSRWGEVGFFLCATYSAVSATALYESWIPVFWQPYIIGFCILCGLYALRFAASCAMQKATLAMLRGLEAGREAYDKAREEAVAASAR